MTYIIICMRKDTVTFNFSRWEMSGQWSWDYYLGGSCAPTRIQRCDVLLLPCNCSAVALTIAWEKCVPTLYFVLFAFFFGTIWIRQSLEHSQRWASFFGLSMKVYFYHISLWVVFLAYKFLSLQCKTHYFGSSNKIICADPTFKHI